MATRDQTNLQPPGFSPSWPKYPALRQLVRVTGPAGAVYNGYVEQWSDKIANFRDREPCYVFEPNGIAVPNAILRARLNGSYAGLPLYVLSLACCAPTSASSPSPSSIASVSSVRSVSSAASSVSPKPSSSSSVPSQPSQPSQCFFSAPVCPGLTVAPFGGAPSGGPFCLTLNPDGTLSGTFVAGGVSFPVTISLNVNEGTFIDCVAIINGVAYHSTASPNCTTICFNMDLSLVGGSGLWTVCVVQDNRCCSSSSSSTSLPSVPSAPSLLSSPAPSSVSSSVSAVSPTSPVSSSFSCCVFPPQLGLFIACVGGSSFQPPPNPIPPGPPTTSPCATCPPGAGTPAYWQFQSKLFNGIFQCFEGLWTLIQSAANPCVWVSDPADPCQAKFTINADSTVQLTLTVGGREFSTYKGTLVGDCCTPIKLALAFETQPGCPDLLAITPYDCQTPSSAAVSPASSCSCQPCNVCMTLDPTGSFYTGSGCNASWQIECLGFGPGGIALLVTINGVTNTYFAQSGSVCTPLSLLYFNVLGTCGEWQVTVNTNTAPCSSSSSSSSISAKISSPSSSSAAPVLSSSSSSSSGVIVNCCPNALSSMLHVTISLVSGSCTCVTGSFPIFFDGTQWASNILSLCGTSVQFILGCPAFGIGGFTAEILVNGTAICNFTINVGASKCSPIDLKFNNCTISGGSLGAGCIGSVITVEVTV